MIEDFINVLGAYTDSLLLVCIVLCALVFFISFDSLFSGAKFIFPGRPRLCEHLRDPSTCILCQVKKSGPRFPPSGSDRRP